MNSVLTSIVSLCTSKLLTLENTYLKDVAEKIGTSQQNLSAKLIRNDLRISEIEEIADVLGYEVEIKFKRKGE